jgi:hypothetical protein
VPHKKLLKQKNRFPYGSHILLKRAVNAQFETSNLFTGNELAKCMYWGGGGGQLMAVSYRQDFSFQIPGFKREPAACGGTCAAGRKSRTLRRENLACRTGFYTHGLEYITACAECQVGVSQICKQSSVKPVY